MTTKALKPYNLQLLFRALADRTRLRLLSLMDEDEVCVCFLVEALKLSQPKISRHLAYLRRAGVVAARREGKWMHYRLSVPPNANAAAIFAAVRSGMQEDREMQSDRTRLIRLCCSPALPPSLKRAPKPSSAAPA
jgi:ArsR family transcriptional regulator